MTNFKADDVELINGCSLLSEAPPTFRLPPEQWAFGVWINSDFFLGLRPEPATIALELSVLKGTVGVAAISGQANELLSAEIDVEKGNSPRTVEINVANAESMTAIVIRPTIVSSEPAEIVLHSARVVDTCRKRAVISDVDCLELVNDLESGFDERSLLLRCCSDTIFNRAAYSPRDLW